MDKYKVKLCGKEYTVDVAEYDEERQLGLSGRQYLNNGEGMLFLYEGITSTMFTTKDTNFDLSIVLLDDMFRIIGYYQAKANDPQPFEIDGVRAVLEIPQRDDIEVGSFMQVEEFVAGDGDMLVLKDDGGVQMALKGDERILSREHTAGLISLVIRGKQMIDNGNDPIPIWKQIGQYIFAVFNKQNNTAPEYVSK